MQCCTGALIHWCTGVMVHWCGAVQHSYVLDCTWRRLHFPRIGLSLRPLVGLHKAAGASVFEHLTSQHRQCRLLSALYTNRGMFQRRAPGGGGPDIAPKLLVNNVDHHSAVSSAWQWQWLVQQWSEWVVQCSAVSSASRGQRCRISSAPPAARRRGGGYEFWVWEISWIFWWEFPMPFNQINFVLENCLCLLVHSISLQPGNYIRKKRKKWKLQNEINLFRENSENNLLQRQPNLAPGGVLWLIV